MTIQRFIKTTLAAAVAVFTAAPGADAFVHAVDTDEVNRTPAEDAPAS